MSIVITAPERDRDLKDAAKAMEVDEALRKVNHLYDGALEEMVETAKRLNKRFAGRQSDAEYQATMTHINTQIEELDNNEGQEEAEYLLESRLFTYAKDKFLDYKGAPADRRLGPKYQRLREDLNAAVQVEVEEAKHGRHNPD